MSAAALRRDGPVARLALGELTAVEALADTLEDLALDSDCHVVTLMVDASPPAVDARREARLLIACETLPQPLLALVGGAVEGLALGVVAASDLVVASPAARFAMPDLRQGRVPAVTTPYLVRAVGQRAATHLLLAGEAIDAAEAARIGLVHEVTADLDARAEALVATLLRAPPGAVAETKAVLELIRAQPPGSLLAEATVRIQDGAADPRADPEAGTATRC